ncbi:MAG: hypothetical protein AB7E49_01750 [Campylobacterales bacterium]
MKRLYLIFLILFPLYAEQSMIEHRDFVEFYLSTKLKEQIKAELLVEMNLTVEQAKVFLGEQIREESERHRRLYAAQMEEFARQIASLKEEVDFLRELVVDANYQRNSNDDVVALLQKRFEELEMQLSELEKKQAGTPPPPPVPQGGQKL